MYLVRDLAKVKFGISQPDENAPERPPSAYVIFSNSELPHACSCEMLLMVSEIREELKNENLTFTTIAKRVGERWQDISPEEKEPYESEVSAAKEKYHAEMAEYKTTKSYREYQQYLTEFKAKHASNSGYVQILPTTSLKLTLRPDGKRPKLTSEETHESTASSGSLVSQFDGPESRPGSTDFRHRRVSSVSLGGLYSATSGLTSPASVTSGPAVRRGGLSSIPFGDTSPLSVSPSTPSARRDVLTSQMSKNSTQEQPSVERRSERMAMPSSDQSYSRIVPSENMRARTLQGLSVGPFVEPRISQDQRSLPENRSTHVLPQLQHNAWDSPNPSVVSTLSSNSTAASSLYSSTTFEGEKRNTLALPPLATLSHVSSYAEPATRPNLHSLAGRKASSLAPDLLSQSLHSSSSAGMTSECFNSHLYTSSRLASIHWYDSTATLTWLIYSIFQIHHGRQIRFAI